MDKSSSKGSMFDGLQIFGKTDAKFSMTNSLQNLGSASSRPVYNSNYQFNNTTLPPPGPSHQSSSLPSNINGEEELPPDSYPLEPLSLDPRQLSTRGNPPANNRQMSASVGPGLPKTWGRSSNTVVNEPLMTSRDSLMPSRDGVMTSHDSAFTAVTTSASPVTKSAQDILAPLPKVSFRGPVSSPKHLPREEPPSTPTFSPEPELRTDSDKTAFFFDKASSEIEKFELDLNNMRDDHDREGSEVLEEMKLCEDTIRASSLLSIQKLLKFEKSASLVEELQSKIKTAIDSNAYTEAERLQNSLDDALKDTQRSQLLQFQPPRHLDSTEEKLKHLNSNRKSRVESLKNFCVALDEQSTRFKSITKKIEVQCSSKIDKQKQELESSQSALDCRIKHLNIDRDYLEQRETNLTNELRVTTDDHNLQMQYQDELLQGVQSEIKVLEDRLRKLREQENSILEEKKKLIVDKVEAEKLHQQKLLELKKEKDSCHIKSVSLENDKSNLSKQTADFETYSSKLEIISSIQKRVNDNLNDLKSKTCESISSNEGLIVNEVHVSVSSDISNKLSIPESLSDIINEISTQEKLIELKSSDVFDFQRGISELKSDVLNCKTKLQNCRGLKTEAISKKRFQDAANLAKEEAEIEAKLSSLTENITDIEKSKCQVESELEEYTQTLKELLRKAAVEQSLFDKECYKALVLNLISTLSSLRSIPEDIHTISRSLLEYDACYTYSFLKMVKRRNDDVGEGAEELSSENVKSVEILLEKIGEETKKFNSDLDKLKTDIEEALSKSEFEKAEKLSSMQDLIAGLRSCDI